MKKKVEFVLEIGMNRECFTLGLGNWRNEGTNRNSVFGFRNGRFWVMTWTNEIGESYLGKNLIGQ